MRVKNNGISGLLALKSLTCYFHQQCFDGLASAAYLYDFLKSNNKNTSIKFVPVNYPDKDKWYSGFSGGDSAIVDFLYHPKAGAWWDHHEMPFPSPSDHEAYKRLGDSKWIAWDPKAPSCAGFLKEHLSNHFRYQNKNWNELVQWADIIDAARYKSAEEAVIPSSPATKINLTLNQCDVKYNLHLLNLITQYSMNDVLSDAQVQKSYKKTSATEEQGLEVFKQRSRCEDRVAQFDLSELDVMFNRYAPFYIYPEAMYSVGLSRENGHIRLRAMRNPWKEFECTNIGEIFKSFGGGGHQRIGSSAFPANQAEQARSSFLSALQIIRESVKVVV